MKHKNLATTSVMALIVVLSGCIPAGTGLSTPPPTFTATRLSPKATDWQSPTTIIPAATTSTAPSQEKTEISGRLNLANAKQLFQSWYRTDLGPVEIDSIQEITPEEVWEHLGVQIFEIKEVGAEHVQSYLMRGQQVWPLHTGYGGLGVKKEDLLVSDMDTDGKTELVYAYALDHDVSEFNSFMRIGVLRFQYGAITQLNLDWRYEGELDLTRDEHGKVLVSGKLRRESKSNPLGYLILQDEYLSLFADSNQPGTLATYTSPRFGISFQYPADWIKVGEDHYEGESGFFQIFPYESLASGLSDAYHRVSFRMVRACTWEANAKPGQYGREPALRLLKDVPGRAECQIIHSVDAQQTYPTVLIELPSGSLVKIQADPDQLALVHKTLAYTEIDDLEPEETVYPYSEQSPAPELVLQTRQLGELTLEEYSLFPVNQSTPMEEQLAGALEGVRARRDPWRAGPVPNTEPESLERDNTALAPFGYRLESFVSESGEQRMKLFRRESPIKDGLSLFPRSLIVDPTGQADFALIVEEPSVGLWLIRRDSQERWDIKTHLDSIDVTFVGEQLAAFEFESNGSSSTLWVTLAGKRIYSLSLPWQPLSVDIDNLGKDWLLELDGTLIVAGEIMNLTWGYGEVYDYHLLDGKPFFFFEKGGQVGISYDGQELPVRYDEVIHGECCGGMNNPRSSEHMSWFYALRDGTWYYVEIGNYE